MTSRLTKGKPTARAIVAPAQRQVAVVSSKRWALINELDGAPEPTLDEVVAWLGPCDLIIAEGYKAALIPKIEVRRSGAVSQVPLAGKHPNVRAIAADYDIHDGRLPVFALDDVTGIADFIAEAVGVTAPGPAPPTAASSLKAAGSPAHAHGPRIDQPRSTSCSMT